jgi:hypothetical protein
MKTIDEIIEQEIEILEQLGFSITKSYFVKNGVLVRIKDHPANWLNFSQDIEDNDSIKKIVSVSLTDERSHSDFFQDIEGFKSENPSIECFEFNGEVDTNNIVSTLKKIIY